MSVQVGRIVECEASTFPLDNLTMVSMAVHSTKILLSNYFPAPQLNFGALHSFVAFIYWHRQGRSLALAFFPP